MRLSARSFVLYVLGLAAAAAVCAGVLAIATARRSEAQAEADRRKEDVATGPRVVVTRARRSPPSRQIELQAEARPYASVTIYAKVSGYLKSIRADKGDRVKEGQVVAVIESPELDRQYDAAVAEARYKRVNAKRAASLAAPGVVSAREAELSESQAQVADAQVAALATQKTYETIRAPFAGTVIARFADPGALVQSATAAQTGALPIMTVATTDRLRVSAFVDQRDAARVHVGDVAEVRVPERPGARVTGHVARVASQLDARTRTMLVEIDVDNREGQIVAGSFVNVSLTVPVPPGVEVPVAAMVLRGRQTFAAIVGDDARVHYRPVVVDADDGAIVRLREGLLENDRVALDLGDRVDEGARVQPLSQDPAPVPAAPEAAPIVAPVSPVSKLPTGAPGAAVEPARGGDAAR